MWLRVERIRAQRSSPVRGASQPAAYAGQQIVATPGSPSATTTITGEQLPPPPAPFGGRIERNAAQSTAYWPARVVPPKGAPNILLIMTDDTGFGVTSTFGGVIPTLTLDGIAANGLRYTNFNSTALCSPTRAAPITGRNHHSMGFGVVSEQSTGYPGHNSIMTRDKANIGRILTDHGYWTSWFGKGPQHSGVPGKPGRPVRPVGPPAWASITSMVSWAAMPTSGSRTCSATPPPFTRTTTTRART